MFFLPSEFDRTTADKEKAYFQIIEKVKKCELTDFNKVIETDYRGFIIDIDFKSYFEINML